jgi:hypothetical protein
VYIGISIREEICIYLIILLLENFKLFKYNNTKLDVHKNEHIKDINVKLVNNLSDSFISILVVYN